MTSALEISVSKHPTWTHGDFSGVGVGLLHEARAGFALRSARSRGARWRIHGISELTRRPVLSILTELFEWGWVAKESTDDAFVARFAITCQCRISPIMLTSLVIRELADSSKAGLVVSRSGVSVCRVNRC
jgi:hypothetical protein